MPRCIKCGKNINPDRVICPFCKQRVPQDVVPPKKMDPLINDNDHLITHQKTSAREIPAGQTGPSMDQGGLLAFRPGGFWMRFWAWLFDATVLGVVLVGLDYIVQMAFGFGVISFALSLAERGLFGSHLGAMFGTFLLIGATFARRAGLILVSWILSQLIGWLYYTIFEVGPMHGTPGKLLFGLQVLGKNDAPISFVRSTARHFFKFAGLVPFLFFAVLTLGMAVDMDSRQVNEVPKIVKSLFIASIFLTPFFFFIFYSMAGWTKKRRALHDILSGCYVVKAKELSALRVLGTILGVLVTILIALLFVFVTWVATHSSVSVSKNSVSIKSPPNYEDGAAQQESLSTINIEKPEIPEFAPYWSSRHSLLKNGQYEQFFADASTWPIGGYPLQYRKSKEKLIEEWKNTWAGYRWDNPEVKIVEGKNNVWTVKFSDESTEFEYALIDNSYRLTGYYNIAMERPVGDTPARKSESYTYKLKFISKPDLDETTMKNTIINKFYSRDDMRNFQFTKFETRKILNKKVNGENHHCVSVLHSYSVERMAIDTKEWKQFDDHAREILYCFIRRGPSWDVQEEGEIR